MAEQVRNNVLSQPDMPTKAVIFIQVTSELSASEWVNTNPNEKLLHLS